MLKQLQEYNLSFVEKEAGLRHYCINGAPNDWAKERETHPRGERRPLWMKRPLSPKKQHWYIPGSE